ncbi:hypothetical protein DL546_006722 [Coniochaeta pulveracea]|uniref:Uncharacterized protein n=1 Tax=Coniochaeta pulveracea TaxID=177199 RepID=A0A420YEA6_9PEZI|nr:hypothetical protein DL546_006722 [Coniochaeta pulveracea]
MSLATIQAAELDAIDTGEATSPPSYTQAVSDVAEDLVQPVILVLTGQLIHAESNPTVLLYKVNRGITNSGPAIWLIEFERMEPGTGPAKQRFRHIYNLHHLPPLLRMPSRRRAEYFIEAVAAPTRGLGHLGLRQTRVGEHWTVLPVDMKGCTEIDRPPFVADAAPVLEAHHRQGAWKWTDGNGRDLALEYDSDREYRLLVTACLPREMLDALVALWCCRVWQQSVN